MSDNATTRQEDLNKAQKSTEYKLEYLMIKLTEEMLTRMEELNITRTQLAKKLGVNKSMITKWLSGEENPTLRSLVKIASVLDCDVDISFPPCGFKRVSRLYVSKANTPLVKQAQKSHFSDRYTIAPAKKIIISACNTEEVA